jgi:hypothetical protein
MKKILLFIVASFAINVSADTSFTSGLNKNHLFTIFQSTNCQEICKSTQKQLKKYNDEAVVIVNFDHKTYNIYQNKIANMNKSEVMDPQFFLNHSVLNNQFVSNMNLTSLKRPLVGELTANYSENLFKVVFSPMKTIEIQDNLINKIKNRSKKENIVDDSYDQMDLTLHVAVTTPHKYLYMDHGVNEGNFINNSHNVLDLYIEKSQDKEWSISIPHEKYNNPSLAFVIWVEDENKNIIQVSSSDFYRLAY